MLGNRSTPHHPAKPSSRAILGPRDPRSEKHSASNNNPVQLPARRRASAGLCPSPCGVQRRSARTRADAAELEARHVHVREASRPETLRHHGTRRRSRRRAAASRCLARCRHRRTRFKVTETWGARRFVAPWSRVRHPAGRALCERSASCGKASSAMTERAVQGETIERGHRFPCGLQSLRSRRRRSGDGESRLGVPRGDRRGGEAGKPRDTKDPIEPIAAGAGVSVALEVEVVVVVE